MCCRSTRYCIGDTVGNAHSLILFSLSNIAECHFIWCKHNSRIVIVSNRNLKHQFDALRPIVNTTTSWCDEWTSSYLSSGLVSRVDAILLGSSTLNAHHGCWVHPKLTPSTRHTIQNQHCTRLHRISFMSKNTIYWADMTFARQTQLSCAYLWPSNSKHSPFHIGYVWWGLLSRSQPPLSCPA